MSNNPIDNSPAELKFQCPACRAKQPLQNSCRRCGADLGLLAKAHRRVAWLVEKRRSAPGSGFAAKYEAELRLLKPAVE